MIAETLIAKKILQNSNGKAVVPPLENGDHLTRLEFERRYNAMPKSVKAELIEGIVYMPSPVRFNAHGEQHSQINGILFNYYAATPGVRLGDNATLILDFDNEPQPDLVLFIEQERGGKTWVDADGYLQGAPELIVEIAASTKSYDLHTKKKVYRRIGVDEYIVWRVYDNEIDWFALENEEYIKLAANENGCVESRVFPGLQINLAALANNDLSRVLADLQTGLQSEPHKKFVAKLRQKS